MQSELMGTHPQAIRIKYNTHQQIPFRMVSGMGSHLRAYDWNGDGRVDLVDIDCGFGPTKIFAAINVGTNKYPRFCEDNVNITPIHPQDDGSGNFRYYAPDKKLIQHYYGFEIVDLDNDRLPDFLAGGLILHRNIGTKSNPVFKYAGPILINGKPFPYNSHYTTARFADFDGDGKRDLLISVLAYTGNSEKLISEDAIINPTRKAYENCTKPDWDIKSSTWPVPHLFFCKNVGTNKEPIFKTMEEVLINGEPVKEFVHGFAMPAAVNWRKDGFADMIVGDCSRSIRYFRNSRKTGMVSFETDMLILEKGFERLLPDHVDSGMQIVDHPVCEMPKYWNQHISFEMQKACMCPSVVDWDGDGDLDIILGGVDHTVWVVENIGSNSHPIFRKPHPVLYDEKKSAMASVSVDNAAIIPQILDWDADGRPDLLVGTEQGYIHLFRNIGNKGEWKFEKPVMLRYENGSPIWTGDINDGYCNGKWHPGVPWSTSDFYGYAAPTFADLDFDGDIDIILGDISFNLKVVENIGTRQSPQLKQPYILNLNGKLYEGGWRCRPGAMDIDGDGVMEVIHPDRQGIFHLYHLTKFNNIFELTDDQVLLYVNGMPVSIKSTGERIHITIVDWDKDGLYDLIIGHHHGEVLWLKNLGTNQDAVFAKPKLLLSSKPPQHDTGAAVCDWFGKGNNDLIYTEEGGWLNVYPGSEFLPYEQLPDYKRPF
ncbi:MAG: FG-GAP repeat domain-containing protein [Sedimentisphaerales bacterium]